MSTQEFLLPYLVSNAAGLLLIYICYRWFKAGKIIFSLIFLAAGIFNFYTAGKSPDAYVDFYGDSAWISFYRDFINGFFSQHVTLFVRIIAIGQCIVGVLLLLREKLFILGIFGGIIFLLAIAPLGIGSAFPCTLFMAFSLYLLYRNRNKK